MTAEALDAACRLAFAVARDDVEADHPVEPPAAMRSFLYVDELPRRAIAVAQQAIEESSEFRQRVAIRADESEVGRAGYLWLQRPAGWAREFEQLTGDEAAPPPDPELEDVYNHLVGEPVELINPQPPEPEPDYAFDPGDTFSPASPPISDAPMATVSPLQGPPDRPPHPPTPSVDSASLGLAAVTDQADYPTNDNDRFAPAGDSDRVMVKASELDFEADALESELSSLRGLVDRLAGERELVLASTPDPDPDDEDEHQAPPRYADEDVHSLQSDLETARHDLTIATSDLAIARQEREEAQRLHSETLKRQVHLEKELAQVREQRVEVENQASETQVAIINLEERLKRAEARIQEADRERSVVKSQLETMTLERNQIREDRAALRAERDELHARLTDVEEKTGGIDIGELTAENRALSNELDASSRELARMIGQAEHYQEQLRSVSAAADGLKTEKIDLRSRLADTELALETTRTQHQALKVDSERLAAEVGTLRAERDGLQSQLTELQVSLSDVLAEQADIRQRNDDDRRSLNAFRVERDVLTARMADLEQRERDQGTRIEALTAEREDLLAARDELVEERGQLRGEAAAASSERTQLLEKLGAAESRIGPLETELQAERRQREELANRLLELDDLAERNGAELAALLEERETMLAALDDLRAERIEVGEIQVERDGLAGQLAQSERRYEEETARLRERLAEVSGQVGELETTTTALEQQLAESQSELDVKRAEFQEAKREAARLSVVTETTAGELEEVRSLLESREVELEQSRQARTAAQDDAEQAKVALDLKDSELQATDGARRTAEARVEELQAELAEAVARADKELASRDAELEIRDGELASRDAELERRDAELERRSGELASRDAELESRAGELVSAAARLEELEAELTELQGSVESLSAQVEAGQAELETARGEAEAARAEGDNRTAELETANHTIDTLESELRTATEELAVKQGELEEQATTLESASEELESARSKLDRAQTELALKRSELEAKSAELEAATSELAARAFEFDEKTSQLDAANTELMATSAQLEATTAELAATTSQLQATNGELAARSAELDEANALLASAPSELALHSPPTTGVPPTDDLLDLPAQAGTVDEEGELDDLDAMAAEVRSALERPSVLDALAGPPTTDAEADAGPEAGEPDESAEVGPVVPDASRGFGLASRGAAVDEEVDDETVEIESVDETPDPHAWPGPVAGGRVDEAGGSGVAESLEDDTTEEMEITAGAEPLPSPADDVEEIAEAEPDDELAGIGVGAIEATDDRSPVDEIDEMEDEDDLDAVSELIARTVSSFNTGEIPVFEPADADLDLTAAAEASGRDADDEAVVAGSAPPSILGASAGDLRPAERPDLGVRRLGGTKRRRIEIPGDLLDDEVAVAGFVVSSPDVVLLVDGDSVAKLGWPSLPVAQQRDALVTYLADLSASSGAAPDVVFDGRIGDDESLPASRAVRIRLSTPPTEPTAALDELVDAYPDQWPIALVTDDQELARSAAERGAAVLNNGQLLDLFIAQ